MLQRYLAFTAILGMLACTAPARAQVVTTNMHSPLYPLLMSRPVQKELNLSETQVKKVNDKIKELTPGGGMMFQPGGGEGGGQPGVKIVLGAPPKGGAAGQAGTFQIDPSSIKLPDFKKIDEEVLKLLEEPQVNRLKQLNLQQQGLRALAQEKLADEVGLAPEQRDLIKHIMDEQRKKTMELVTQMRGEGGLSPQELGEQMKKQREAAEKDIALLLSDEQKEKWDKLTGPKFDFKGK